MFISDIRQEDGTLRWLRTSIPVSYTHLDVYKRQDILCGDVNPSGKLADTFASSLYDYPSTKNFHESPSYVDYTEDIYAVSYTHLDVYKRQVHRRRRHKRWDFQLYLVMNL